MVRGAEYRLWGLIPGRLHLFGSNAGPVMLLGAASFGRDVLTRNLYATRVSLSLGLVGVVLSFLLGLILGGISEYSGGTIDNVIQRAIDFLLSPIPTSRWLSGSNAVHQADCRCRSSRESFRPRLQEYVHAAP